MKLNIIFNTLIIILVFSACNNQPAAEKAETIPENNTLESSLQLSQEQLDLAGIELGKPELRKMSDFIECNGTIEVPPQSLASVYSPVNGFIKSIKLLPGNYIKKGAFLTSISHPDLVKLQRELLECKARLDYAEKEYERKKTLSATDATSQKSLEQAKAEYAVETARYQGLKAELKLIGISVKKLEEEHEIQPSINLYAPISGYLTAVNVNQGKLVTPQDLLFEIVNDKHVHLELKVFAKDLAKVKKGQRIQVQIPGSEASCEAEVYLAGKRIDGKTKTAPVHGHLLDEKSTPTPGTYIQARILTNEKEVLTLPIEAIIREGDQAYIFIKDGDTFEKVAVTTGMTNKDFIEVKNLSQEKENSIVTKGAYYVNGSVEEEE